MSSNHHFPQYSGSSLGAWLVAALLACAGCGQAGEPATSAKSKSAPSPGDPPASASAEPKTLLFSVATTTLDFAREMAAGGEYCGGKVDGITVRVAGPPNIDPPAQVKQLNDLVKVSESGVAIENLAPDLFMRPMLELVNEGRLVVAVDTTPAAGSGVETYIGNNNRAAGRELAEAAIARLPADATGKVILGTPHPGVPVLEQRAEGMKEAFAKSRPKIEVLGPFDTKSDPAQNFSAWNGLFKAHPDALAFLATGDLDSISLAKAKQTNSSEALVAGFDLNPLTLAAIKAGTSFATMSPEHFFKGCVALRLLADASVTGKPLPKGWIDSGHLLVTSENIDQIIARQASAQAKGSAVDAPLTAFIAKLESHTHALADAT